MEKKKETQAERLACDPKKVEEFFKLLELDKESVAIAREFEQSTEDAGRIRDKELASLN